MNSISSKKKKLTAAITACAVALTMLVGGTLAYFYQSNATNRFEDLVKKVVGHDDFNEDTGDKDVYIENTGSAPVYVRIQLTEDFKISAVGGGEQVAMSGYEHTDAIAESGTPAVGGHIHAPEGVGSDVASEDDASFHSTYFSWEMGGEGKDYLSAKDTATYANTSLEGVSLDLVAKDDLGNGVAAEGAVVSTAPACEVITMADYAVLTDEEKTAFIGWVIDTEANGGWAYWSQMLLPGEATGLLLNQVNTLDALKNNNYDYTYDIHVAFEAVDETDKGLWTTNTQTTDEFGNVVGNKQASAEAMSLMSVAKSVYDASQYGSATAKYFLGLAKTAEESGDTALANKRTKQANEAEAAYKADPTLAESSLFEVTGIDTKFRNVIAKYCDLDANGTVTVDEAKALLTMNGSNTSGGDNVPFHEIFTPELMTYFPNIEMLYLMEMNGPLDASDYNLQYLNWFRIIGISSTNTVSNLDAWKSLEFLTLNGISNSSTDMMDSIVIRDLPNLTTFYMYNNAANNVSFSNLPKLTTADFSRTNYVISGTIDYTGVPTVTNILVNSLSQDATTKCTIRRLESQTLSGTITTGIVEQVYNTSGELVDTITH